MAMKINAGDFGRSDLYHVLPADIVVDESQNGRFEAHDDEAVQELAQSLLEYGQKQPVLVRRLPDFRLQLVAGYRRWKAATLVNTKLRPEQPLKLQCRIGEMNEEEAFLSNIIENHDRRECNDLDYAFQHRRLRDEHGWDDDKIAKFYRRSLAWVQQKRKLLNLDGDTREQVARGNLTTNAALDLARLPEPQRKQVVEQATGANGHVNTSKVRSGVRERGQVKPLTLAEFKVFLKKFDGEDSSDKERKLSVTLLQFLAGQKSERQAIKVLEELLG